MQQGSSTNAGTAGTSATAMLTDEQILGLEPENAAAGTTPAVQGAPTESDIRMGMALTFTAIKSLFGR